MSDQTEFSYTIYLRATAVRVWRALTDPVETERYWGVRLVTDWRVGSAMTWQERGAETTDPDQVVLEAEPPRRLAYTWHTFTPEWAEAVGADAETLARIRSEQRSRAAFELEVDAGIERVRLTLTHTFPPRSHLAAMCAQAWPLLLSEMKSQVERTLEPVPTSRPGVPAG